MRAIARVLDAIRRLPRTAGAISIATGIQLSLVKDAIGVLEERGLIEKDPTISHAGLSLYCIKRKPPCQSAIMMAGNVPARTGTAPETPASAMKKIEDWELDHWMIPY